jgi:hypothetical protein
MAIDGGDPVRDWPVPVDEEQPVASSSKTPTKDLLFITPNYINAT